MDYYEYAMYHGPEAANRAAYDALYSNGPHVNQQAWARIWADDATRYGSAEDREARDLRNWFTDKPPTPRTITLQPGEYQWADAPAYRLHPDAYDDIVAGLRQFESYATRPTGVAMNLATVRAFADLYDLRFDPTAVSDLSIFGIPVAIEADVPIGVLRMRSKFATRDVALREATSAGYVKKG